MDAEQVCDCDLDLRHLQRFFQSRSPKHKPEASSFSPRHVDSIKTFIQNRKEIMASDDDGRGR